MKTGTLLAAAAATSIAMIALSSPALAGGSGGGGHRGGGHWGGGHWGGGHWGGGHGPGHGPTPVPEIGTEGAAASLALVLASLGMIASYRRRQL